MKIEVLGNSFTWFDLNDTQMWINDELLFECPQGCSKRMLHKVDFAKIKYIFITHFHSDHFGEIHLIFDWIKFVKPDHKVTVVAPKGAFKRLMQLFKSLDVSYSKSTVLKYFTFMELSENQKVQVGPYAVQTFKTKHLVKKSLGYTIQEEGGKVVGFCGDSLPCDGVTKLIEQSDVVFINSTTIASHHSHMTVDQTLAYQKQYPNKEFHSVHVTPEIIKRFKDQLHIPMEGDVLEV